ncbi:MAG: hypothetical protein RMK60_11700 [Burkholderiales bacterium]|nr:hypothetical protein [Burkholderiales bacterium]
MRLIAFLILLNALTLAAGLALEHWRQQPRALPSHNADKVRLLARPTASAADVPAAQAPKAAAASVAAPVCLQFSLTGADAYAALRAAMQRAGLQQLELRAQRRLAWWVYWPPLDDAAAQAEALAAIRAAGAQDYAPIRAGPMARAISLGMFDREADARAQHAALTRAGLTALRYGPRPGVRVVYLDVPAELIDRLPVLQASPGEGVALAEVACAPRPGQQAAAAPQS